MDLISLTEPDCKQACMFAAISACQFA